ncbi:MAG: hypothetical protein NT130_04940 [Candidatus Micrarchaeota archaeon]|nr:hypothetical protein [Candidatus Micrarchaeota archaeon]
MRKLSLLLSIVCLMVVVHSTRIASPNETTTISFFISNPAGSYEFCVDSVLIKLTDHIGDIHILTPLPVYPKVCICPPSENSSCLSYASAGKAYGQSQGYSYAQSSNYQLDFIIQVDPNPDSSLTYPGVPHNYEVDYSYKFVNCRIGCWFEDLQPESYSDMIYIHGLTQSELSVAQQGTPMEQLAANSIAGAQQEIADAFNAIEQANSTIILALNSRCVSTSKAESHLSLALQNYSDAMSALITAQSAYKSKEFEASRYNATLAQQLAIQTKNEAGIAINLVQAGVAKFSNIADKLTQANLSVSYSKTLETQASNLGIKSYEAKSLISLAAEYLNRTQSACLEGEYDVVVTSADTAIEKSDNAKNILELIIKDKLAEIFGTYAGNLTKVQSQLGEFSSNYSNSTIDQLKNYRDNIKNGTFTEYLLYIQMLPANEVTVEKSISAFPEINKVANRMYSIRDLGVSVKQDINFSEVNLSLQKAVSKLSELDFNSSLNFTQEADTKLTSIETGLKDKINRIDNAINAVDLATAAINDTASDQLLIISPDLSEAENALQEASIYVYSDPDRASNFARQARALAGEQKRRIESIKFGIVGVVIIIIILAFIINRIKSPFRTGGGSFRDKH